jgi:hypothetical protein
VGIQNNENVMAVKVGSGRFAAGIAVALWTSSLFIPSLAVGGDAESALYRGSHILAIGWAGPIGGAFAWYANIPWLVEVVRLARGKEPRLWLSAFALLLAFSMVLTPQLPIDGEASSGTPTFVAGAWVWLLSFCPLFGAGLMKTLTAPKTTGKLEA